MTLKDKIHAYFKKKNLTTTNNRKKVGIILFATSIGLFFLFAMRLSYIVIVGQVAGTSLAEKTKSLYEGGEVIKAKRGTIYDRNGLAIAEDATSYSIRAVLSTNYVQGDKRLYAEAKNFDKLAQIMHDILGSDKAKIIETLEKGKQEEKYQVEFNTVGKKITLEQKTAIEKAMEDAGVAGLEFDAHPARIYPNGIFSSHFIGYAAVENPDDNSKEGGNGLVGMAGLEAAYNDVLAGKDGKKIYQLDNNQNPLPGTVAETDAAKDGQDIYTTIDSRIQSYLETLMTQVDEEYPNHGLTAILMDAKNGEIQAMAQRPTYNPEDLGSIKEWHNLLVEDNYEPGSTMKVLTTAAAIDQGIFDENETYSTNPLKLYDRTINDWDFGEKGPLTMRQALSWSSNIGMVILEQRMQERWQQYLQQFGFGRSTYSGLPGENAGLMPADDPVSKAWTAFGQAIGVTNFQMMQAFTAVANDGTMIKPQYIKKTVDPTTGQETINQTEVVGHPITKESAQKVREMMRDVVESEHYGSAYGIYQVPGYNISAKTGTAQVADPTTGKYYEGPTDYLYSIVEMVPAEDPQYILYLTIKRPDHHDGTELAKIANPLMKRVMDLKNATLEDTADVQTEKVVVNDYRNLTTNEAANDLQKMALSPIVLGTGDKVKAQSIESGTALLPGERVLLLTDSSEITMPDTTTWSKADLIQLGKLLDVEVKFEGDGYCVGQSLAPFEKVTKDAITFTMSEN